MTSWAAFRAELDHWQEAGRNASFWWRDDDAETPSPALDQLLALRASRGLPLALAVIPAGAGTAADPRFDGFLEPTDSWQAKSSHRLARYLTA